MDKIAVFIKTIYREKVLYNCIESIELFYKKDNYRLYIADDGPISETKRTFYNDLIQKGHCVLFLPEGTGASASRNQLLACLESEKYILRMDDDFEISAETNIEDMIKILDANDNIGVVADLERQFGDGKGVYSGQINTWQGSFLKKGTTLIKNIVPLKEFNVINHEGIKYIYADFTRNMLLLKREIFEYLKWNEDLKFSWEHEDFLLQIKESKYDLVFILNSIHYHREDIVENNLQYVSNRNLYIKDDDIFFEKWGITDVIINRPLVYKLKAGFVKITKIIKGKLF